MNGNRSLEKGALYFFHEVFFCEQIRFLSELRAAATDEPFVFEFTVYAAVSSSLSVSDNARSL